MFTLGLPGNSAQHLSEDFLPQFLRLIDQLMAGCWEKTNSIQGNLSRSTLSCAQTRPFHPVALNDHERVIGGECPGFYIRHPRT